MKSLFTFAQAVRYMRKNEPDIDTVKKWQVYSASGERYPMLPANPADYYHRRGEWPEKNGWSIFFGVSRMSNKDRGAEFRSWDEAVDFNHQFEIRDMDDYKEAIEMLGITDLPLAPEKYYPKSEGIKFSKKAFFAPKFLTEEKFVRFFSELNIETYPDWQKYSKESRPKFIPSNPFTHYGLTFKDIKRKAALLRLES